MKKILFLAVAAGILTGCATNHGSVVSEKPVRKIDWIDVNGMQHSETVHLRTYEDGTTREIVK